MQRIPRRAAIKTVYPDHSPISAFRFARPPSSLPPVSEQDSPTAITFASREDQASVDEASNFCPKFNADGLIPALALDEESGEPLMMAWMNEEALRHTLELGEAVYYSRSRQELWHKGATSGHTQKVLEIRTDCDQDALILYVRQQGAGACHTGRRSCFYRTVTPGDPSALNFVQERTFDPDKVYGNQAP